MYLKLPDIYPYDLGRFKDDFPNTSPLSEWSDGALAEFGIMRVTPADRPAHDERTQALNELAPQQVNGVWTQVWQVVERSSDDQMLLNVNMAIQVRSERDQRLRAECDCINPMRWETMTDAQKDLARAHRLALLDVPNQPGFPWSVTWPVNPL